MEYYFESEDDVLKNFNSNENGLSECEAKSRFIKYGPNRLKESKKETLLKKVLKQLSDPMLIVLIIAVFISGFVSFYFNEPFTDTIIILLVVVVNTILGVYQENKAEKAIDALNNMSKSMTKVIRGGNVFRIESEKLVPGDIVLLEAGDAVPADLRILQSFNLKVEESALTGESVPVEKISEKLNYKDKNKKINLADRKNMAYMGSTVVFGRAKALVLQTGMNTEMGKIAKFIDTSKKDETPLQKRLRHLSKILSLIVIFICIFIFAFKVLFMKNFSIDNIINTFMLAISLAVAAIPEGLATVVTIQLALGVTKMAKNKAIVRKLTAVETLGCTQIICSDKTGTLTQNKMTVVEAFSCDEGLLFKAFSLCNDVKQNSNKEFLGDPTEIALLDYSKKFFDINNLKEKYVRVKEIPFSSERKMMSTIHLEDKNKYVQFTKGALDVVLKRCSKYFKDGKIFDIDENFKNNILKKNKEMSEKALRVLCAAFKIYSEKPENEDENKLENNLIFLGLAGMIDPVRKEAIDSVKSCKQAGIRPIMITGDHKDTAVAIAKQLGIILDESEAITGDDLEELSDKEFESLIGKYSVYARVRPEHKVRIVNMWQKLGKVVAMTGDGVNDAPSIKNADIGIGMGQGGTDVTKNVSDMVLADDNFSTIVKAVKEGRRIYTNIQKSIQFLISSNISEVLVIFIATILGISAFSPLQILWINLISDTFPALALGMEHEEGDLMKKMPRKKDESLFSNGVAGDIFYQGIVLAIISVLAYFVGHFLEFKNWNLTDSQSGSTMIFVTLCLCEMFHVVNMRSQRNSIFALKNQNFYLLISCSIAFILVFVVVYTPELSKIFGLKALSLIEILSAILLSFSVIPIVELVKLVQRKIAKM